MLLIGQIIRVRRHRRCPSSLIIRRVSDTLLWLEVVVGVVVAACVHPKPIRLFCYGSTRVNHALFQKLAGGRETVSDGLLRRLLHRLRCLFHHSGSISATGAANLAEVPLARSELVTRLLSRRGFHLGDVRLEAARVSNLEGGAGVGAGLRRTPHLDITIVEGAQHDG